MNLSLLAQFRKWNSIIIHTLLANTWEYAAIARWPAGEAFRIMAEITCYRPMNNFNAIAAIDSSCALNALWMERHQPWELGDATNPFMNNATTFEQRGHDLDSWNLAATFKEPRSVLDLQTSSLSSQHSFNSVSDGTSTALQTVTDQLLSDEQDSAFLVSTKCTGSAKPNSGLIDQNILTWMELMRDSEPDNIPESRQEQHLVTSDQSFNSCADMDLDFDVGTMESIATTPSSHQGTVTPTFEPLCDPTTAQNQVFSHNSPTLLCQASPGFQQSNDMSKPQGTTTTTMIPSGFDSMNCAIPASQLQDYTVVPTAELLRLLSSQNQTTTTTNPVKGGHGSTDQGEY